MFGRFAEPLWMKRWRCPECRAVHTARPLEYSRGFWTTAYAVLGMLSIGPMSGYDMKRFAEQSIGHFWSESYGQLYPTLRELESKGLVDMSVEERERGVDRKVYQLTHAGLEELRDWIASPVERKPARDEMLLKLFFGRHVAPERLRDTVRSMRAEQEVMLQALQEAERQATLEQSESPDAPYWTMTLQFGLMVGEAYLRWCDLVLSTLSDLSRKSSNMEEGA